MTPLEFSKNVEALKLNFGFKVDGEGAEIWLDLLFDMASKYPPEDIKYGFREMFKLTNKQWSQEFKIVFGKPPAIAVWLEFFSLKSDKERVEKMRIKLEEDKKKEGENVVKQIANPVSVDKIQALLKTIGNNN